MAPRANWKGYLRLSLVSCPIALYPATSEREKIRFHNINAKTGNPIRMRRVDEETGKEVDYDDIVSGYEVGKGQYIEVTDEELDAVASNAPTPSISTRSFQEKRSTKSTTFGLTSSPQKEGRDRCFRRDPGRH
jgi:Ku protein